MQLLKLWARLCAYKQEYSVVLEFGKGPTLQTMYRSMTGYLI